MSLDVHKKRECPTVQPKLVSVYGEDACSEETDQCDKKSSMTRKSYKVIYLLCFGGAKDNLWINYYKQDGENRAYADYLQDAQYDMVKKQSLPFLFMCFDEYFHAYAQNVCRAYSYSWISAW